MDDAQRYTEGMSVRRAVLGHEHVDRALDSTTEFTADFQDFITRTAWGDIWSRAGLARSTRRLLTIALLVALNRGDELRMHLRAALNDGIAQDEIKEVLLHCAIYCGLPAANSAFQIAAEVMTELRTDSSPDSRSRP